MSFIEEILTMPMLFYTVLLGLMVLYWLIIFVGLLDLETLDAIFGFGEALEGAGEAAGEAAAEAAVEAGVEAAGGAMGESVGDSLAEATGDAAESAGAALGPFQTVLGFLGVGTVPVTIIGSVMVTAMWFIAFCLHHYVSPALTNLAPPLVIGLFIFLATMCGSFLTTGVVTRPLRRVFKVVSTHAGHYLVGKACRIRTSCVDATFGEADMSVKDSFIIISVRCSEANDLKKGDEAVIIEYDKAKHVYEVRKL